MTHITIIGGGIAGLATAYYLQKKSREQSQEAPIHYTLVDSEPCFGGKIVTADEGDFVIEGGPDSFITQKPWGRQLCLDLGLAARLIPTNDDRRNIYVLDKGKLVPFPGGYRLTVPTEFIPFALSPLISPLGKLRMGLDLVIPPRQDKSDESLGSFIRRRLGQEALDKIGAPIMAGIYVADPERLSIQSTFPMFVEMEREYGSLIKAMRAARQHHADGRRRNGKPPAMFNSLRGGMKELTAALVDALEGDLHPNCHVTGLRYLSPGFEITFDSPDNPSFTT
ncbi:MAG TPA: protoporphyrinogen oxidase, partial [Anaerolineae bacterium]